MFRSLLYLTAFGALLAASTAMAQPGPGGPGRGFFGGGMRMPSAMLVRIPEVQKELAVKDDQKQKLQDVATEIRQEMQSAPRPNFQNFQDMSDEERQKAMSDMRAAMDKVNKSADEKLAKVLTSDQMTRLKELQLQSQGAGALLRRKSLTSSRLPTIRRPRFGRLSKSLARSAAASIPTPRTKNVRPPSRRRANPAPRPRRSRWRS